MAITPNYDPPGEIICEFDRVLVVRLWDGLWNAVYSVLEKVGVDFGQPLYSWVDGEFTDPHDAISYGAGMAEGWRVTHGGESDAE